MNLALPVKATLIAVLTTAYSGNASASEFWANKKGGGFDEVLEYKILGAQFTDASTVDQAEPEVTDGSLTYEVNVLSEADLHLEGVTDLSAVTLRDENGTIVPLELDEEDTEDALKSSFRVEKGTWKVEVKTEVDGAIPEVQPQSVDQFIISQKGKSALNDVKPVLAVDASESLYSLGTRLSDETSANGKKLHLSAFLTDNIESANPSESVTGRAIAGEDTTAIARIQYPNGTRVNVNLKDNGEAGKGDSQAGDNIFSGTINLTTPGDYNIKYVFKTALQGERVKLTSRASSTLDATRLRLLSTNVSATHGNVLDEELEDSRYGFPIRVSVSKGEMEEVVRTRADIWAQDLNGNDVIVGWTGGLVQPQIDSSADSSAIWNVPFTFHSGWLNQGSFQGELKLKNIEITSINNGDQILFSDNDVEISGVDAPVSFSRSATASVDEPTDEMLNGTQRSVSNEVQLSTLSANDVIGKDILFLRGWCDDNSRRTSHFSSNVVNRSLIDPLPEAGASADARALQIMEFLGWESGVLSGIVAHSQGGLVAASLLEDYSYVFDEAALSAGPNVVTMGSPFNGSVLASQANGILSTFVEAISSDVPDCFAPFDLRRSSNPLWRNNIGERARDQIASFHTTHARSRWFAPRDCFFGSYIIPGADDGAVAPSEGEGFATGGQFTRQFSGYCHTMELGDLDQWDFPEFVDYVNTLFDTSSGLSQPN